ncbi:MAG: glycosyltransferase family 2 protein [Bacteroidetes bacterium]|nr:glycosyltransferase family 2 protein [Bacteroidota bacterium]
MKLIIQIPCYNEEKTLPIALAELPRQVDGFDTVEWLIIDDGSTDRTVGVARDHGVDHIIGLPKHQGLAKGYMAGLEACLALGADVIVNTDADNQYFAGDIPKLTLPILEGRAQIVIGARSISEIAHFSPVKKLFQKFGSWVVRQASHTDIPDATSGFRAMNREAARLLNVFNEYTYTLETIIQAGQKNLSIISVPVRVNDDLRPSRLLKSIPSYIKRSVITIIRIFVVYKPFRFFFTIGSFLVGAGILIGIRYLYLDFIGEGKGHVQSIILASILLGIGFQTILVAFLADLLSVNRRLLEDIQFKQRTGNNK